jgi:protein TonB
MFAGFETRSDADATRRYAITSGLALAVLGGLATAAIVFSGGPEEKDPEPEVIDVTFQAPPEEAPPPPVPVPKPETVKVAHSDAPRPTRAPDTPTKIADKQLEESDETRFKVTDGGDGGGEMVAGADLGGVGGGLGSGPPPPPPPRPRPVKAVAKAGPIPMPEEATPPKPLPGNAAPAYPEEARTSGVEGEVYLKIVINEDGSVGDIEVKKGEEPFVSAAVAAVKAWKYTPALLDGKPITIYRIIKVPFKLKA